MIYILLEFVVMSPQSLTIKFPSGKKVHGTLNSSKKGYK